MRSFHLVIIFFVAGFACKEVSRQPKRHNHIAAHSEKEHCRDRPINPFGKILPIDQIMQQCSEHCWVAVLEMVGLYYGREIAACELAGIAKGDRNACCALEDICSDLSCNHAILENKIDDILIVEMGLESTFSRRILTEETLQIELSNGRPVIIGYAGSQRSHVALIIGFDFEPDIVSGVNAVYLVVDPYVGFMQMDYEQMIDGVGIEEAMPWVESWWGLALPPHKRGCRERF